MARTRLRLDQRREHLLRTGVRLLGSHDSPPPVAAIAKAAGVSKGLLYHCFPDKEDFWLEVVRTASAEITEATRTDPSRPLDEQIAQAIDGFLDYAEAHSAGSRVIFGGRHESPRVPRLVREQRDARAERIIDQVAAARPDQAPAVRASAAPRTAPRGALACVEATTLHWLDEHDVDRAAIRTLLIGALTSALALAERVDPELRLAERR